MTDTPVVIANSKRWAPVAALTDRFFDIPVWKSVVQYTPLTESEILEHRASELDLLETEGWKQAQSDKERRSLIDGAYERHRTRGTDAGMKIAVEEAGGEIRRIIAPPSKFFPSQSTSVEERNAWLAQHPEMRIYPRRVSGTKEVAMCGADFAGRFFPGKSTALARSRLRVTLVKDGVETELETASWQVASEKNEAINEIVVPGKRGSASFLGTPFRFIAKTDASLRRYIFRNVVNYCEKISTLSLRTARPTLEPIDVDGEIVAEKRNAPRGATFGGRFLRFTVDLKAELAVYRRIRLFDPTIPLVAARAASHLGHARLTMPPHTAEIQVAFFGKTNPNWGRFCGAPVVTTDKKAFERLVNNMKLAKRESDKIYLDTKIFKPVKAGRVKAGEVKAGGFTNR